MKASKIFALSLSALSLVLPLFFLPLTSEFYFFNKTVLLYFATMLLLLGWAVKIFISKSFSWSKSVFTLPIIGLMLTFLLSNFIQAPNKLMTLTGPTGLVLSLGLLYFIIINNIKGKKQVAWILTSLILSSVVLAWITIFAYLDLTKNINLDWLNFKDWTPTGSILTSLSIMVVLLPGTLYWAFKTNSPTEKVLLFLASSLQTLAGILIVSLYLNKTSQFIYLPPQYGWQISVDGFKTLKTALFGVGPGNFLNAYTRFKPAIINNTSIWNAQFGSNSNQYLNLLSTTGILGLLFYLMLVSKSLKKSNFKGTTYHKVLYLTLLASFMVQLIIAANMLILFITFVSLALTQVLNKSELETEENKKAISSPYILWAVPGTIALLALIVFYFEGRLWLADYTFRQSLVAAQENKGIDTYNLQIKAIGLNPWAESYRLNYANTNFALANSLASQENLSDHDKANVNQLIGQSIREAKAAVDLNPQSSQYWANLASLYRNLINVADQADQWSLSAYLQAVSGDPTNPLLRLEYGSLFYGLKDFDRAIEQFRIAANLKPDYANAYYNLAASYQQKEDWVQAYQNLQTTLSVIPADSADREKVTAELEELKAKLPAPQQPASQQGQQQSQLSQPEAIPSPKPGFNQVNLPEEAAPEVPQVPAETEPSPTASAVPAETEPSPQL